MKILEELFLEGISFKKISVIEHKTKKFIQIKFSTVLSGCMPWLRSLFNLNKKVFPAHKFIVPVLGFDKKHSWNICSVSITLLLEHLSQAYHLA
ncbi:hypothetical protein CEXT_242981 [Caerostris extrusa]|uniref:LAGLIDADG homing endonuclease n=1 Tax=Caerostris extrusa TaxID=172846 RepID=A0AAV4P4Y5_CAEEX|nr:hypothetical protein CEXT_242981 [Caerostris extrusa]